MLRRFVIGAATALFALTSAHADTFPSKTITMIVGVAPGGTLDTLARLLAKAMTDDLKRTVIVENTVGAGGLVGLKRLMSAPADGHTLMFTNMSLVIIPHLHPTAGVNPAKDLDAIGQVATVPMVLAVSNQSGIKDLPQMLDWMRKNPGKMNLGSGGPGTTSHLAEALFFHQSKTQGQLIQYRGSGPALVDVMAGTIQGIIDQTVTLMNQHNTQKLRAIAISSKARIPQMPDVPTFAEGGLPQFNLAIWNGVMAPKGLPPAVSKRLSESLSRAIDSPEFKERLVSLAALAPTPAERGSAPLKAIIDQDTKMVAELVKEVGLIPQK